MPIVEFPLPAALALSLAVHAGVLALGKIQAPPAPSAVQPPLQVDLTLAPVQPEKPARLAMPAPQGAAKQKRVRVPDAPAPPVPEKQPATMTAPPAPTAEEWRLASTYGLKNSKRYRYAWGQQVRSMMGTAVEGVRQGLVRLRIGIAPDGTLARADVLGRRRMSPRSSPCRRFVPCRRCRRRRRASRWCFPSETGWPPIYKYDCLAEPPSFSNRFAWDGTSPRRAAQAGPENASLADGAAHEAECPDTGPDSIEAEEKDMEREFKEWGAAGLNGAD